jgi:hypothetical protein
MYLSSSLVLCRLLWSAITASGARFSLLGKVRIPNSNIYSLEWGASSHGIWLSLLGGFGSPSSSINRFIGMEVQATMGLP